MRKTKKHLTVVADKAHLRVSLQWTHTGYECVSQIMVLRDGMGGEMTLEKFVVSSKGELLELLGVARKLSFSQLKRINAKAKDGSEWTAQAHAWLGAILGRIETAFETVGDEEEDNGETGLQAFKRVWVDKEGDIRFDMERESAAYHWRGDEIWRHDEGIEDVSEKMLKAIIEIDASKELGIDKLTGDLVIHIQLVACAMLSDIMNARLSHEGANETLSRIERD